MMRHVVTLLVTVGMVLASSAAFAVVSITHVSAADGRTDVGVGEQISIDVNIAWDGDGALAGVFTSTGIGGGGATVVSVQAPDGLGGFVDRTGSVFGQFVPPATFIPGLASTGPLNQPGDDPNALIRTVQYSGLSNAPAGGAAGGIPFLVTTITLSFDTPGVKTIGSVIGAGDSEVAFSAPGSTSPPPVIDLGNTISLTVVPEPGTALLMGLGLAGLGLAGRRNER